MKEVKQSRSNRKKYFKTRTSVRAIIFFSLNWKLNLSNMKIKVVKHLEILNWAISSQKIVFIKNLNILARLLNENSNYKLKHVFFKSRKLIKILRRTKNNFQVLVTNGIIWKNKSIKNNLSQSKIHAKTKIFPYKNIRKIYDIKWNKMK
jgi:hypothetical protein